MGPVRIALAVAVAAVVAACSGPATSVRSQVETVPATYYLALGDSLSQGVQPDAAGTSVETEQGYPDQLYAMLHPSQPALQLVKLGCPGETTATMIHGGICKYRGGSQLAAAVAFLSAHRGHVRLVTIDIGANDPEDCGSWASLGTLVHCVGTNFPAAVSNLDTILARLRAAAGPDVRIVGMSYYLPALAEWRNGLPGQAVAWLSERLAAGYNDLLDRAYAQIGRPGGGRVRRLPDLGLLWSRDGAGGRHGPAQRRPDLPVDLGVREPAARAEPAREPGRLRRHRPGVPQRGR